MKMENEIEPEDQNPNPKNLISGCTRIWDFQILGFTNMGSVI